VQLWTPSSHGKKRKAGASTTTVTEVPADAPRKRRQPIGTEDEENFHAMEKFFTTADNVPEYLPQLGLDAWINEDSVWIRSGRK